MIPGFTIEIRRQNDDKCDRTEKREQVRFLRLPEVLARTGLSRSTIYVRLDQGRFPKPVSLGARAVGWIEAEVDQWIRERIDQSRVGDSRPRP